MRVACVLRSGGVYGPEHVYRLRDGVLRHLPGAEFVCLSDVDLDCERIPLAYDWPCWFAKMELYRPDLEGDFLYFDLDTSIVGDLSDIASVRRLTLLRDFYRPTGLGSGLMFLPKRDRRLIWREWMKSPHGWMRLYKRGGDQIFLERYWRVRAARWQDIVPGQVVSFKVHCRAGVPDGSRIVCFHGNPRPWETPLWGMAA